LITGAERKRNIASMNGKRLNYCSEIQTNSFDGNTDTLKAIISGEPMEARLLYCNNFTAHNIPLLMANANKLPAIKDWSNGMRRRLVIIPFDVVIPENEQQKDLASQLAKEYSGIINWVFEGRQRFIKNGYKLTDVPILTDMAERYIAESTNILKFMASRRLFRNASRDYATLYRVQARDLYIAYNSWCARTHQPAEAENKFGRVLLENGYTRKKTETGSVYQLYISDKDSLTDPIKERKLKAHKKKVKYVAESEGTVTGTRNLAIYCRVKESIINRIMTDGALEGLYALNGQRRIFDAERAKEQVDKYLRAELLVKQHITTKERKAHKKLVRPEIEQKRKRFNERMCKLGEAFRKPVYVVPMIAPGVIFVTDEFDYDQHKDEFENYLLPRQGEDVKQVQVNTEN
jgi:phage/plasmid-associated DNA primase